MSFITADISLWQFPASLILGASFLLITWLLNRHYRASRLYRALSSGTTAVVLLLTAAVAIAIEGTWSFGLYHTYPFLVLMLWITACLGLVTLRRLPQHNPAFLLCHAGLFVILWGAFFGAPDTVKGRMVVHRGESAHIARTHDGQVLPLPFEVQLDRFEVDLYDDGHTPRQFRSQLLIDGTSVTVEVNAPARHSGYTLYQESYDAEQGAYTVLGIVRDPWLWIVWLGTALLAVGSILYIFCKR